MATDLIEQIRNELGYKPLPKIDPNTQEPVSNETPDIGNAAIPAVLAGFYKGTRSEEAADKLINTSDENILHELFCEHTEEVTLAVANYARVSPETAQNEMQKIIYAVKSLLQKDLKEMKGTTVMTFFTTQRSNILKHLPVELHMGELINDPAMDDRTNKMEGPMSGFMHTIEQIFSASK
jgi:hypothetical protein